MRSIRITGLGLVAVFAISPAASSTEAATRHLTLETAKGSLTAGARIVATSTDLTTTTPVGALKCASSVLTGTLKWNNRSRDSVSVHQATATGPEPDGGCMSPLGEAQIEAQNLPWTLSFDGNG